MAHLSYNRVGSLRSSSRGGFRLNPRRFSVSKLRARFACFFRFLSRWRCLCMRSRKSSKASSDGRNNGSFRKGLVREEVKYKGVDCGRMRSFGRSNSFYVEAIADCLEFIKRSAISVDQRSKANQQHF